MRFSPTRFEVKRKIQMSLHSKMPLHLTLEEIGQLDEQDFSSSLFQHVLLDVETVNNLSTFLEKNFSLEKQDALGCVSCIDDVSQCSHFPRVKLSENFIITPAFSDQLLSFTMTELDISALSVESLTPNFLQRCTQQAKKILVSVEQYLAISKEKNVFFITGNPTLDQIKRLKKCKLSPDFLRASLCLEGHYIADTGDFMTAYRTYTRCLPWKGKSITLYDFLNRLDDPEENTNKDAKDFLTKYANLSNTRNQYANQLMLAQDFIKANHQFYDLNISFQDQIQNVQNIVSEIEKEAKKIPKKSDRLFPGHNAGEHITAQELLFGKTGSFGNEKMTAGMLAGETFFRSMVVEDDLDLSDKFFAISTCDFGNMVFQGAVNFSHTKLYSGFWIFKKSSHFQGANFSRSVHFCGADLREVNFKDIRFKSDVLIDHQTQFSSDAVIDEIANKTQGLLIFTLENGVQIGVNKNPCHSAKGQIFLIDEQGVRKQLDSHSLQNLHAAFKSEYLKQKKSSGFFTRDNISKKLDGVTDAFSAIFTMLLHAQGDKKRRTAAVLNALLHPASHFRNNECSYVEPIRRMFVRRDSIGSTSYSDRASIASVCTVLPSSSVVSTISTPRSCEVENVQKNAAVKKESYLSDHSEKGTPAVMRNQSQDPRFTTQLAAQFQRATAADSNSQPAAIATSSDTATVVESKPSAMTIPSETQQEAAAGVTQYLFTSLTYACGMFSATWRYFTGASASEPADVTNTKPRV